MFTLDGNLHSEYESVKDAAKANKVKPNSIANNCRGESRTVNVDGVKYIFRYKEPQAS